VISERGNGGINWNGCTIAALFPQRAEVTFGGHIHKAHGASTWPPIPWST
jgi:hypothetical protein